MPVRKDFLALKLVKGREDVDGLQEAAKQSNKPLFCLFPNDGFSLWELLLELFHQFLVSITVLALLCVISIVVGQEVFEDDNRACIFVSKQGNCIICGLLEVPETNNITKGLDRVQYPVCPGKCLYQSMLFQVLIHKESVQGGGIKASQEHIDHNQ